MEFSDTEKKMINQLRKEQKAVIRFRWMTLCIGILGAGFIGISGVGIYIYCISRLLDALHKSDVTSASDMTFLALIAAFLWPKIYIGFWLCAWLIAYTLVNWNGNPQKRLLLKLIDEKIKETEGQEKP